MSVEVDVRRAARMMDARKPGWFRRIVFKRLNMQDCDQCIAGQAGLDWSELADDFAERFPYPKADSAPFSDPQTVPAWLVEIRKRQAS